MAGKKETKVAKKAVGEEFGKIATPADLKAFLQSILDKMKDEGLAGIYTASAMNFVLNLPQAYELLNNENRELARDIWLRLKQTGFQIKNPPLLFSETDGTVDGL